MKKSYKTIKTIFAAIACGILCVSCQKNLAARPVPEEPEALPGISVDDAKTLGEIGHSTKMFTAEEVAQNIRALNSVYNTRLLEINNELEVAISQGLRMETELTALAARVAEIEEHGGGAKPVYPAVTTNSIVAGDQTLLVLSPIDGTSDSLPPYVTNSITAGDETILVLSPAE